MKLWRFLRYERPYLLLCAATFLLPVAVFSIDPRSDWQWRSFTYSLVLATLIAAGFFVRRYFRNEAAVRRMREEDGEPLSLEAEAYRDVLEQKEREHIRALNEIRAKQQETYDFVVSWFHEIKTPISVLRLMRQTEIDPRSFEEEVARIEHYVDQALYYAKLDNFNQDYEIENCDLEQLVKEAVKAHSKTFIAKKIRLRLELPPAVVQSDSKWLMFILNQLLSNALKYTGENGEIAIFAESTPREKRLVVRDDGIGIDARDLPRVFHRGFTGANGRTHAKSTGMGLYLAQELSRKLGHDLTCESVLGRYSAFTIHFPRNHDPYLDIRRDRAATP